MGAANKILWVVNYDNVDDFVNRAVAIGATGVAIRTDNDIAKAIPKFHAKGVKVFGWRWPSAKVDAAMKEADKVVALLQAGLDGYFVDPEGVKKGPDGKPTKPYDWDQPGLETLAEDFCKRITSAAPGKAFGTTSHYRAKATFPKLPWNSFFKYSTVLLPQAYWRSTDGTIGHGIPADNYRQSIDFWVKAGGDRARIVPMGGELGVSTPAEIKAYAAEAQAQGVDTLHFYTYDDPVKDAVWAAVTAT